ncbi:MAG TPA: GGDEF domain-containing protein, partial [Usitatibacteraceae bacterium]|nr:GGDEF domain-containing protein [Usitatibacteraceae bacterium]
MHNRFANPARRKTSRVENTASGTSLADNTSALSSAAADSAFRAAVHADKIRLLYRQSFQGVFSSLVAGALWCALMWDRAPREKLLLWLGTLFVVALARAGLFLLHRRHCTDNNVHRWLVPYASTVMLAAVTWGFGTVWVMPADSMLHQAITYVFMIGLAGAALSAYGVFMGMTIGIVCAVLLPIVLFFFSQGDRTSILLALSGVWFFITTLRAIKVHNHGVEESFRRSHELDNAKRAAEQLARTDALTGLNNRRAFNDAADALLRVSAREGRAASVMLFDIDDFKRINDRHGHATGDAALLHVARLLGETLRISDVCGRLGGDEFAVLLPNTDLAAAREVAAKLLQTLAERPLPTGGGLPLTLSVGLAGDAFDIETLLHHADQAMYRA